MTRLRRLGNTFTYSVKFRGFNPVGAVAVVVATSRKDALAYFYAYLKSYSTELYLKNTEAGKPLLTINSTTRLYYAHAREIGKVTILLDGEY